MSNNVVEILRLGLTSPCPVPVVPETGEAMRNGEPIPLEERTELCAVDAGWMIGAQRVCDIHLRDVFDMGAISGTFESLIEEAVSPDYVDHAKEQAARPWSERRRYSQEETRSWAESAKEHGLA